MSAVMKTEVIREATAEDITRLIAFAEVFWKQTEYASVVNYDIDTMMDTTLGLIDNDVVLYAEDQGEVVGLLCIMISPFPMNRNFLSACEWGFYVAESHRHSGLGVRLLKQAEELLKEKKVTFFTMISLANLRPKAVGRFYERMGFRLAECDYVKVIGG